MTSDDWVDVVLRVARAAGEALGGDTHRMTISLMFQAMLKEGQEEFVRSQSHGTPKSRHLMAVARELCGQDHPDCMDHPVLPPGMPPMVHRVPVHLYRPVTVDSKTWSADQWVSCCVDVGSLVGPGPTPLWCQYIEIARRVIDADKKVTEQSVLSQMVGPTPTEQ